ncbi:MAG: inorganic pyrophosphatase [Chloroflexota bacterium]
MTTTHFSHWRPHPWHGLAVGPNPPAMVYAYVEMTPFDVVKYEIDKVTGYLKVDRPQRSSSQPPALYGFIPRTYCGPQVAALERDAERGDGDPLDICVLSERPIIHPEVILTARVVGGIRMLDRGESDDKIIAVLENDAFWGAVTDIEELPPAFIERLRHYFSTYKLIPGQSSPVIVHEPYGRQEAQQVIEAAMADYDEQFGSQT